MDMSVGLFFFESRFVGVSFATSGLYIEHQIFHVQTKLTKGFLDQVKDPSASLRVLNDSGQGWFDLVTMLLWKLVDLLHQYSEINWKRV